MKTLKDRIIIVLAKNNKSYIDLCEELKYSEEELDEYILISNNRVLEKVSKLLKIPLYSFYRTNETQKDSRKIL